MGLKMNKLTLTLTLLAAALGANSAMANTSGVVYVTGLVEGQTCKITDDTSYHNLRLPNTRTASLGQQGAFSPEQVHFNIDLEECEKGVTAGVSFDMSNVDTNNVGTLTNLLSGPGAAENVNIQLMHANAPIDLANQTNHHYLTTQTYQDTVSYAYAARYYATGQSSEGYVRSFATFKVDYK